MESWIFENCFKDSNMVMRISVSKETRPVDQVWRFGNWAGNIIFQPFSCVGIFEVFDLQAIGFKFKYSKVFQWNLLVCVFVFKRVWLVKKCFSFSINLFWAKRFSLVYCIPLNGAVTWLFCWRSNVLRNPWKQFQLPSHDSSEYCISIDTE